MESSNRRKRGIDKYQEVYCGDLPLPEEGDVPFFDVMVEQLFGEVWTRPELSLRDRRLITMGVIAALGERDTFCIQVRSAVKNGELSPVQVREILIHLAQYIGYPRAAGLFLPVEETLSKLEASES